MKIIIHRGTHQIGGSVTEIKTGTNRIFIDFGSELPDLDGKTIPCSLEIEGLTKGEQDCGGVFFSHYHGDHVGMMDSIMPGIPLYMGEATKEILLAYRQRINSDVEHNGSRIRTFGPKDCIQVGDISVIPYFVDHSAFDAHMFLIKANGKSILYTGDFRTHGFKGKGLLRTLKYYIKQVDVLITEGTNLSRNSENMMSERDQQQEAKELFERYKYIFVICASTNIDRIGAFNEVTPNGKYFLCDTYQKEILDIARKHGEKHTPLYRLKKVTTYGENLKDRIREKGFVMLVRSNAKFRTIIQEYKEKYNDESLILYSMWEGYLKQKGSSLPELMAGFQNIEKLHSSGHATQEAIREVCDAVSPRQAVIPMHTSAPQLIQTLGLSSPIRLLRDGEEFTVE